jgi:hypothetical protein
LTPEQIHHLLTYLPPTQDQIPRYQQLREAGEKFARAILHLCPPGPDQYDAIRKVREAVMTANAGIACHRPFSASVASAIGEAGGDPPPPERPTFERRKPRTREQLEAREDGF